MNFGKPPFVSKLRTCRFRDQDLPFPVEEWACTLSVLMHYLEVQGSCSTDHKSLCFSTFSKYNLQMSTGIKGEKCGGGGIMIG